MYLSYGSSVTFFRCRYLKSKNVSIPPLVDQMFTPKIRQTAFETPTAKYRILRVVNLILNPLWISDFYFCRRPSRYVPYKGTFVPYDGPFGASDQGQTLDVWGPHPDDANHMVKIPRFVTLFSRFSDSIFLSDRKKLNHGYRRIRISTTILDHTDRN
jgi:hypothetical protein